MRQIKNALVQVQVGRKRDNQKNIKALNCILDFIKNRKEFGSVVIPTQHEIQFIEVFKKLTESGWIIKLPEVKQIIKFLGI